MTPQRFSEILSQQLGEKANYNKDLIDEKNRMQAELIARPNQERARLRETAILDPLERERFVTDNLAVTREGLGSVTDLLNARGARFNDVIGQATNQYNTEYQAYKQAQAAAAAAAAAAARQRQYEEQQRREEEQAKLEELRGLALGFAKERRDPEYGGGMADSTFKILMDLNRESGNTYSSDDIWQLMGNKTGGGGSNKTKTFTPVAAGVDNYDASVENDWTPYQYYNPHSLGTKLGGLFGTFGTQWRNALGINPGGSNYLDPNSYEYRRIRGY